MHDVVINKVQSIQRCVKRACELAIDVAAFVISRCKLGLPTSSREAFELLRDAGLISSQLCDRPLKMVGFRIIAMHAYQALEMKIVAAGDPEGPRRPSGFRRCHPPVGGIVRHATT